MIPNPTGVPSDERAESDREDEHWVTGTFVVTTPPSQTSNDPEGACPLQVAFGSASECRPVSQWFQLLEDQGVGLSIDSPLLEPMTHCNNCLDSWL